MDKSIATMRNIFLLTILSLLPNVFGECTCDPEDEDRDKSLALRYKMAALVAIFIAGAFGVLLPMAGRWFPALSPEKNAFFIMKAFAAGVILATGFIHILPDAFERLTSPCISATPWGEFPFTGFIAMVAAIGTLMVDSYATSYYKRRSVKVGVVAGGAADQENAVPLHSHATHGHAHGSSSGGGSDILRHRVISQVLELGIIVHSVIIGIALGASESPKTIKPLIAALSFHQLFEGMGLGGCITQAKFNSWTSTMMVLFFSITTPVGIAIGIGISNTYDESSPTALIVEGVFDSAAAGILIYMALVDLLSADFMSPRLQNNGKLMLGANASLLIGAGCMSLLAKWA